MAATMREAGIEVLVTNDVGFSRVEWIKVYRPGDLKEYEA
jgi:predicted nucleic acid-binding protein